jgi:hypothetical protein
MQLHEADQAEHPDARTLNRLREEIGVLERRLAEIGPDGDCGYEKAMIRFFHEQIAQRRQRLGLPKPPA